MISGPAPSFSALAWLVAGLALATVGFIDVIPPWLPVPLACIAIWRLIQARRGIRPRQRWTRHGAAAGMIALLWGTGNIGLGIEQAAPLCVALVWIKLLELDAERDLFSTASPGIFLAGASLLGHQDLMHTLVALAAALVLIGGLVWYHAPHLGGARAADGNRLQQRTGQERRAVWRTFGVSLILIMQALPVALALFVLVPRTEARLRGPQAKTAQTGVSDRLDPGRFAENREDQSVAFRVDFEGQVPPLDELYWRGVVLWRTDGDRWWRGDLKAKRNADFSQQITGTGRTFKGEVSLPSTGQPWLYVPECATSLVTGPGKVDLHPGLVQEGGYNAGLSLYRFQCDLLARPADAGPMMLDMAKDVGQDLIEDEVDDAVVDAAQAAQERVRTLAKGIFAGIAPSHRDEVIDRLEEWFVEQKFAYTLKPGEMGAHPMATFLTERKRGYCSHFASAAAVLLRYAGISTRIIGGYRGGEVNPQGGFLVVRQSHAHAWCEAFNGSSWRRIDLTDLVPVEDPVTGEPTNRTATEATGPEAQAAARAQQPWHQQAVYAMRTWRDYLEARWSRTMLAFDREVQQRLMAWFGFDEAGAWAWIAAAATGLGLAVFFTWLLFYWLPAKIRVWRRPPHLRAYSRFQRALADAGVARRPEEGPQDHGIRAAQAIPEAAVEIQAASTAWIRLRYGLAGQATDLATLRAAPKAIQRGWRATRRLRKQQAKR